MPAPRFDRYVEIKAKFNSMSTDCGMLNNGGGHEIKAGEIIGYARVGRNSHTHCAACWARWKAENEEADAIEAGYINSPW